MRWLRVLGAAVLVLSLSGCWWQSGFGPSHTAFNDLESEVTAANVGQLVPAWTGSLGGNTAAEPLVDSGWAYVRSAHRLSAFNLETGATRWSVAVGGPGGDVAAGSTAAPAFTHDSLWVPTTTGQTCGLAQINPADGATISSRFVDGVAPGTPPSAVRFALCATGNALATGSWLVVPSASQAVYDSSLLPGGPFCPPGVDFFDATARVTVIDLDHSQGWTLAQNSSGCGSASAPVAFQPAGVTGDQLLVAQGSVVSAYPLIPCTIGQLCPPPADWSVDVGGQVANAPVVLSNGDIAVTRAGAITVIDGTTHAVEWTAPLAPSFPLAATPTTIYVVSTVSPFVTTILSALPADGCGSSTCTPTWTSTLPAGPTGRASIGGDVVYVGHGRVISALPAAGCGAATCAPLWDATTSTTQGPSSPPTIENGVLLVGNRDGTVAAFSLPA